MLLQGNIDYAKVCESSAGSFNLAELDATGFKFERYVSRFAVNLRSWFCVVLVTLMIFFVPATLLRGSGNWLQLDTRAWAQVLQLSFTYYKGRVDSFGGEIDTSVKVIMHRESSGVEGGSVSDFADARKRCIFKTGETLVTLSAEESSRLEDLLMARSELNKWKSHEVSKESVSTMVANILAINVYSIQSTFPPPAMEYRTQFLDLYSELL